MSDNSNVKWIAILLGILLLIWAFLLWNGNVNPVFGWNAQTASKGIALIGIVLLLIGIFMYFSEKGYFQGSSNQITDVQEVQKPGSPGIKNAAIRQLSLKPLSPQLQSSQS